ncbi:MAG: hypothetical protein VB144_04790 [Clostridia bacterium]|nr:hypothetical protein [Clostridia bacterium]
MIYVGHFSFSNDGAQGSGENEAHHGYFTAVNEAESVEEAIERFAVLIRRLHQEDDMFTGVDEVFLDACVECREIPESGFLAHFVQWTGTEVGSISTAIRGATDEQAVAYHIVSDEESDEDGGTVEAFVVFD